MLMKTLQMKLMSVYLSEMSSVLNLAVLSGKIWSFQSAESRTIPCPPALRQWALSQLQEHLSAKQFSFYRPAMREGKENQKQLDSG